MASTIPTSGTLSNVIAVIYVTLWVTYYILVHASKHSAGNHAKLSEINPAILILAVESIKLIASLIIFSVQKARGIAILSSLSTYRHLNSVKSRVLLSLFRQYFPVAFLYMIYNNLMIVNLRYFDPTSYLILSSLRLILTAALWEIVLKKRVCKGKRKALVVISVGIFVKELPQFVASIRSSSDGDGDGDGDGSGGSNSSRRGSKEELPYVLHLGLVLVQMSCSVLATVYNEAILKKNGQAKSSSNLKNTMNTNNIPTVLQNSCLYIESILLNAAAVVLVQPFISSDLPSLSTNLLMMTSSFYPIAIVLTLAMVGIVTSFMLRHIDSVAKAVASSTEVAITTVLGVVIFGYDVTPFVALSVFLVGGGTYAYAMAKDDAMHLTAKNMPGHSLNHHARGCYWCCPSVFAIWKGIIIFSFVWVCFIFSSLSPFGNSSSSKKMALSSLMVSRASSYFSKSDTSSSKSSGKQFETAKEWFEDTAHMTSLGATSPSNFEDPAWLDENLHKISRWNFSHHEFEAFVTKHIHSYPILHAILESEDSRVLEIGSGVGAFSRSLLRMYPGASVVGIDFSEKMVEMSERVVGLTGGAVGGVNNADAGSRRRYWAAAASMQDTGGMRAAVKKLTQQTQSNSKGNGENDGPLFHLVMMIGSLCYLPDHKNVEIALANALENLKLGGFLLASMLPETQEAMRSCETVVGRSLIQELAGHLGYQIVALSDMEEWGVGNQVDRYSVVLQKTNHVPHASSASDKNDDIATQSTPSCTNSAPKKPQGVTQVKYERVLTAQKVLQFISFKLQQINAPIAIISGTALHEFRDGDSCFMPRITDKDIDISVFEAHLPLIAALDDELKEQFGWTVRPNMDQKKRLFAGIHPLDRKRARGRAKHDSFQIDVYGFQCNAEEGTIWFPWDQITTRINAVLPFKQHSPIQTFDTASSAAQGHDSKTNHHSFIHMPADPACLLENVYGPDFRTPKTTSYFRQNAFDEPVCETRTFNASDRLEFTRQLMLCSGGCDLMKLNAQSIANVSVGLQANAPFCNVD